MKVYKAKFNKDSKGVFAISLVNRPALESLFVALNETEQPVQFSTIDVDKQILVGLVLEPNKPIYRVNEQTGEEYNIIFDEETVEDLAYNFFQSNSHHNSTIEHDPNDKIQDVTFVESWIVQDSEKDKSALYGFNFPKGSWLATMKVNNKEVWDNYIKTGKVLGFSIDAMLSLEENNNLINENMSTNILETIKETIMTALSSKEEVVKLGMIKTIDGVDVEYDGDMLEVGKSITVTTETGEKVNVPIGEYELEDGTILVVVEEGIVAEVRQKVVEETVVEEAAAPTNNDSKIAEEISTAIKSVLIKYAELEKKVNFVINENQELKKELVELSNQPAAKPIKASPAQVNFNEMTKKERILFKIRNQN